MVEPELVLSARRAVEGLRVGIPNRPAVQYLGVDQPIIVTRFLSLLTDAVRREPSQEQPKGFLIEGDFGSGKSHILKWLEGTALAQGFACSKISVSKEAPPSNLTALYRAAIQEVNFPDGRMRGSLGEALERVDRSSRRFIEFDRALSEDSSFNPLFVDTLFLSGRLIDRESVQEIIDFWDGGPQQVAQVRRRFKEIGEYARTSGSVTNRSIEIDRFRFASRLLKACGYNGWVILLDEIELVAKLGLSSRLRSYANLAALLGEKIFSDQNVTEVLTIGALTTDFRTIVFSERNDRSYGNRYNADELLAQISKRGIDCIQDPANRLVIAPLDHKALSRCRREVSNLYETAYGWSVSDIEANTSDGIESSKSLRLHIRNWITRWDLMRIYGNQPLSVTLERLSEDLSEQEELTEDGHVS